MIYFICGIVAFLLTFLFDFIWFQIAYKIEMEKSWKALNERRESEGKERWDKK